MDEYIDKNAAVGILEAMSRSADCECIKKRLEKAAKRVSAIPAANVAPVRRGHWIEEYGCQICSECGEEHEWDKYRAAYCDVCGAKMDGCKEEVNA